MPPMMSANAVEVMANDTEVKVVKTTTAVENTLSSRQTALEERGLTHMKSRTGRNEKKVIMAKKV